MCCFNLRSILKLSLLCCIATTAVAEDAQLKGNADSLSASGKVLKFHFTQIPPEGKLVFPRLNARLKTVYWEKQPEKPLKLTPEITEWVVHLQNPPDKKTVIAEFLDAPEIGTETQTLMPSKEDGTISLPAHFAQTRGEKLRFEPQPHKNTVGYWTQVKDWAFWKFNCQKPGDYHLEIFQGCGKGHGGSEVEIRVVEDGKTIDQLTFIVEDTGHFQNFKKRRIGSLTLPKPGDYQLEIRPRNIANKAVMDVRKVELIPDKS